MNVRVRRAGVLLSGLLASLLLATGCGRNIVLHPAGPVGRSEAHLIYLSIILVLIVVVPVIVLMMFIVMRYRDKPGNKAAYKPEWSENRALEVIWWAIPIVIIGILGAATAKETYSLTKPPEQNTTPYTVEVTSLNWKWLFQYPDKNIATVNYCVIPTGRPIQFVLTANAPMNSFWVPELGGQEYTMPGMAMRLWLQADKPGTYYGHGANFTGEGFANMQFDVIAKSQSDFEAWENQVKQTAPPLTETGYKNLTNPSVVSKASYSSYPANSFMDTVMENGGKYMSQTMSTMQSLGDDAGMK
ncbi:quinol oxidase subunit 2 [Alicyclobacillus contaminans]|uniref:cytochrome c oxidase subunit II n=1 Tax=Alicyclobacillus contaminans TaxID=392016 RepID=UPI000557FFB0|nr:cytochrome c oxidase subunit II [Alicyclobacillus contaminans]GMA51163.1 quinol oxidase subunit 2 [Alicyclobacillus contaminans]